MTKQVQKTQAIKLRKEGHSYSYIKKQLNVSKSTLTYWLVNIPYIPNKETIERIGNARVQTAIMKNKQKLESIERARNIAKRDIGELNTRDLFMLGLGIYMGEGTKTHGIIRVINANPQIIRLAIMWFKKICGLETRNFSARIHIYPDNSEKECIKFWSKELGLPKEQFQKTQVDRRKDKKIFKRGKLPYGTIHVTVKSCGNKEFGIFLSRKINAWIDEVLE